jgi:two-component system LytT family response regulator
MIRVLIVDDEPLARKRLRHLLSTYPDFEIVAEAGTGAEAVAAAGEQSPDLILLDIQLPDMNGFGVLERLADRESVAVMFVTAYDEHALAAFEARAFDYLLKPVAPDRFEAAIERARMLVKPKPNRHARRFLVERGEASIFVSVEAVDWFESAKNYVLLHVKGETFLMRSTLESVERRLDPEQFARVNRGAVVNVDRIAELQPWTNGEYRIRMKDSNNSEIMWTRRFVTASLKRLLGE